jgi:superfamily II DNA or RNA helicase
MTDAFSIALPCGSRGAGHAAAGLSIKPRPHQETLCAQVAEILRRADHAYLEAPTGTGKTLAIALIAEKLDPRSAIYLTHSADIAQQASGELARFARAGLIRPDRLQVMTWQMFCSAIWRGRLTALAGTDCPDLVFVDECHFGGTESGMPRKSFATIKAAARQIVWVSATPWNLEEKTLGQRGGHTAALSMEEAYRQKLLNPVELLRVDCGLHIRAAVANLERLAGSAFSVLSSRTVDIDEADAEQTYQELEAEIRALTGRKLTLGDVAPIVRHRYRLMADLYLARHRSERAMFWLPNRHFARECAAYITKRLPGQQRAEAIVDSEGLAYEAEQSKAAIASFEDATSDVRVACVVYRLREGFDSPELRLGFDCSWSPSSLRIAVQKLGRLTRVSPHKPTSQYYYAVDVKTVAGVGAHKLSPDYLNTVREAFESNTPTTSAATVPGSVDAMDPQFAGEALLEARALHQAAAGSVGRWTLMASVETLHTKNGAVQAVRMPLVAFDQVDQFRVIDSAILSRAVLRRLTLAERVELVVQAYEAGEKPPTKTTEHIELARRCRKDSIHYDVHMTSRMRAAAPGKVKAWDRIAEQVVVRSQERRARVTLLVDKMLRGEPRPSQKSNDGKLLSRALTRDNKYGQHDLIAKLQAAGLWTSKAERMAQFGAETEAHIARIIGAIECGRDPPRQGTADRSRLSGWLSPCGRKTRQDVRERIAACRPDLLPKGITYADRDRHRTERTAAVVCYARENGALPTIGHPLASHARSILDRKLPGSGAVIKDVGTILPMWIEYNHLLERLSQPYARPAHAVKRAIAANPQVAALLIDAILTGTRLPGRGKCSERRDAIDYVQAHLDDWRRHPHLVRKLSNFLSAPASLRETSSQHQRLLFGHDIVPLGRIGTNQNRAKQIEVV